MQKYRRENPNFVKKQLRRAREKHKKNPEIRLAQWKTGIQGKTKRV